MEDRRGITEWTLTDWLTDCDVEVFNTVTEGLPHCSDRLTLQLASWHRGGSQSVRWTVWTVQSNCGVCCCWPLPRPTDCPITFQLCLFDCPITARLSDCCSTLAVENQLGLFLHKRGRSFEAQFVPKLALVFDWLPRFRAPQHRRLFWAYIFFCNNALENNRVIYILLRHSAILKL